MLLEICTLFFYPKSARIVCEDRVISKYSTDQREKYVCPCLSIVPSFSAYVTHVCPFCTVSRFLSNSSRDTSVYILCSCYIFKFSVQFLLLRQMAALKYRKEQQHHVTRIGVPFCLIHCIFVNYSISRLKSRTFGIVEERPNYKCLSHVALYSCCCLN